MKQTRRALLMSGVAAAALAGTAAYARMHGGIALGGGGATLIKTVTVQNTSGSTVAANSHTPAMGLFFKKGDLPSGTLPTLQDASANVVPYTYWGKRTWSDGSLKFIGCLPRFTSSIAGSGTAALKVYTTSYSPSVSGRALSELYAANISIVGVGWDSTLSGTWTCAIQSANVVETVVVGDGPAGKVWRLLCNFNQSGSPHGQLVAYIYVFALQDNSGNLAGFRILPRITQPYYNVSSPANDKRNLQSLVLKVNGTTVLDPVSVAYSTATLSWASAGQPTAQNLFTTSTTPNWDEGTPIQVSSNAAGLTTGTTYFVQPQTIQPGCTQFCLFNGPPELSNPVAGATGSVTATPGNSVCQFGSQWIAQSNGRYVYVQGGGSLSADPALRIQMDQTYDHTTHIIPPYDMTIGTVSSNSSFNWQPQGIAGLTAFTESTSERDDIGPLTSKCARHWYTQAAVDEQVVRVVGLAIGNDATHFRDVTTKGLINLGNPSNTYAGMPSSTASSVEFRPSSPTSTSGITQPASVGWNQVFYSNDFSHLPEFASYAYLYTGEPQYMDLLLEEAVTQAISQPPNERNITLSGTTYYGIPVGTGGSMRTSAWASRSLFWCAGLAPDTPADGTSSTQYVKDIASGIGTYMVAWYNQQSAWFQTNGFWYPSDPNGLDQARSSWQVGYLLFGLNVGAGVYEDSNCLTMLNNLMKWPVHIRTLYGNLWNLFTYYEASSTTYGQAGGAPLISSDANWGGEGSNEGGLSWSSSTNLVTITGPTYTPANGDKFIFWGAVGGASQPGGTTTNTPYYAVNVSGNSFNLSTSPGGSAITITTTGSINDVRNYLFTSANPPTTCGLGTVCGFPSDYMSNAAGGMGWALANGCTTSGLSAAFTECVGRTAAASTNYLNDPKYKMASSY